MFRRVAGIIVCSLSASAPLGAQQNLGFETRANGRAVGWGGGNGNGSYEIAVDSAAAFAGQFSLRTRWIDSAPWTTESGKFAVQSQRFPIERVAGRKLHLTGYIRTQDVTNGYAGFWMRVDGPSGPLALENMGGRGATGTTPWTRYDIELPVDSGATAVFVGILHPGNGTAWFDSLTVEAVGPAMPRTVASAAAVKAQPRPFEDMTRLLTDAELALPRDTVEVPENPATADWVRTNARPIRSLGATDFSDLRFFAPLLKGKRIVQLGESGHGVAEFSLAKVRLIKYLHEELGYDVMAFESSTYECERAQHDVASLTALELMRGCIFGVWNVAEALPLFEYIKQTQTTKHPLILAGFDEQTSSGTVSARPGFFRSLASIVDSAYAQHVYEMDSTFLAVRGTFSQQNRDTVAIQQQRDRFVAFYDSLATFFQKNRRAIEAAKRDDPNAAVVARQAATSMTYFARQLAVGPTTAGTEIRDLGMANNLDFLLNELYPGKKVIVWAHNFHIQHRENTRNGATSAAASTRTMGTWVAERHRKELYTIGLFMYRGSAMMNNRVPYNVAQSRSGSLESILHQAPWRYSFVDFSQVKRSEGSDWIWKPIDGFAWGVNVEHFVPRDEYDGVLFIDTAHVPTYR